MRVTISQSSQHLSQKFYSSSERQSSMFNKQQKSLWMSNKKKLHNKEKRQFEDGLCCDQGIFSKCLPNADSKKMEDQSEVHIERPQRKLRLHQQLQSVNQQANSRLKVASRTRKEQQRVIFPQNLEILRNIKVHQNNERWFKLHVKFNQNEDTKKNTAYISRQVSVLSSLSKKQIHNRPFLIGQCNFQPIAMSQKKLNLTVSKKSKLFLQQCAQIVPKIKNEGKSPHQKSNQDIVFDKKEIFTKKNTYYVQKNLHVSQSQFKIVDPLDEFKSINTQYLKKRIDFSSVQSERQQLHNHIAQSIFYIKEKDGSFWEKQQQKQLGDYYDKKINVENSVFSESEEKNSGQSIVLQKNFQRMFKFSDPTFSKIATSEKTPNLKVYSSRSYCKLPKKQ